MFDWFARQFDSKWNSTTEFQPFVPLPPSAPVYASPADGATGVSTTPALAWEGAICIVMASPMALPKARLHLVMEGGQPGEVFDLGDETIVGRTGGDITFPHDGFMSGRHARVERRGSSYVLTDEGSRNGTFIKIRGEVELKPGDMILIGKQLFRFDL